MTTRILLFCLITSFLSNAQKFQTVVEVQEECGQLSFMSNQEAEIAVDKILEQFGLTRTFVIQECPDIKNAVAKIIQISPNYQERYIFYDSDFLDKADGDSSEKWGSYFILAHEIGHHLNGHSLDIKGSTPPYELEADYFSGTALGLLGASLEESKMAIETLITYEKATSTHPAKSDRLKAIEKGWNEANNKNKRSSKQELTRKVVKVEEGNNVEIFKRDKDKKNDFFKSATVAFNQKKYKESANSYLKAYRYDSEDLSMLYFSAVSFVLAGELDLALRYFLIIIKQDYRDLSEGIIRDVNIKVGLIYDMKNQNEDAIKFLELLVKGDSEDRTPLVALANLYLKKNDKEKASEFANFAIKKKDVKSDTSYNLARVFFLLGNFEKASIFYKEAIKMDKTLHNAYLDLSSVYLSAGNATANQINSSLSTLSDSEYASLKSKMDDYYKSAVSILKEGIQVLPNAQGLKNRLRTVSNSVPK